MARQKLLLSHAHRVNCPSPHNSPMITTMNICIRNPYGGRPAGTRPGPPVKNCPIASSSPRCGHVDVPVVHLRIHCSIMLYHVKGSVRLAGSRRPFGGSGGVTPTPPYHLRTGTPKRRPQQHKRGFNYTIPGNQSATSGDRLYGPWKRRAAENGQPNHQRSERASAGG